MLSILKPIRRVPAKPRRLEVLDVSAPTPGSESFLPLLDPRGKRWRADDHRFTPVRSATFDHDLQRVLAIFAA
jgi:hypothetical protein